jgi:hypothetical protein
LLEYGRKTYKLVVVFKDIESNKGACMSFMWLLKENGSDIMSGSKMMFWFPSKAQLTLDIIQTEECRSHKTPI